MAKIDVTDEAVMDGSPVAVYTAFLNEFFRVTKWWMPHIRFNSMGSIVREGKVFDATINPESRMSLRCSAKVTKLVEDCRSVRRHGKSAFGSYTVRFQSLQRLSGERRRKEVIVWQR